MTNPTLKALQRLLERKGNLGIYDFGYCQAAYDDYLLEKAALRTLIDLHQDVEGDMPQEIWADIAHSRREGTWLLNSNGWIGDVEIAPYSRADTHINELTKRISDG